MINTPNTDITPIGYIPTHILASDTYVTYKGELYVVVHTITYQDRPAQFTTHALLLPVDDDGEDLGKDPITVNLDMCDPQVI